MISSDDSCSRRGSWLVCFVAVFVVSLGWSAPSFGEGEQIEDLSPEQREQVLGHIKSGKKAYDSEEYEESRRQFRSAWEILRHPDFAYRLALSHEKLGNPEEAIEFYEKFLDLDPDAKERKEVEDRVANLRKQLRGTLVVETEPAGASVRLADRDEPLGTTRLETELQVGEHQVIITKEGYREASEVVEIEGDDRVQIEFEMTPVQTAAEEEESGGPGAGPYLTMALGGIGAIGSMTAYIRFRSLRADIEEAHRTPEGERPEKPPEYDENVSDAIFWERSAWIAGGVGAAALVSGVSWWLLSRGGGETDRPEAATRSPEAPVIGVGPAEDGFVLKVRTTF